jgi:hypothetical protein
MAISVHPTVTGVTASTAASPAPHQAQPQKPQTPLNNTQAPTDTVNISPKAISALQQARQTPSQAIEQIDRAVVKAPNQ